MSSRDPLDVPVPRDTVLWMGRAILVEGERARIPVARVSRIYGLGETWIAPPGVDLDGPSGGARAGIVRGSLLMLMEGDRLSRWRWSGGSGRVGVECQRSG